MHFLDFLKLIVSKKWFYFNIFLHIFHKKHHLKPIQKSFKSLKIDSFQGLRPWTPLGGLQRPPDPQLDLSRGLRPPHPLCWLRQQMSKVSVAQTYFL